jgi:phosphohistidine phosphatase
MIVYIVRHAWADHPHWHDDHSRPLTDEGKERFRKMLGRLVDADFAPQLILSSPLVRCRQTAELIAEAVDAKAEVIVRDELEPGSNLRGLLKWVKQHASTYDAIAWVGHAPDVSVMTAALIGDVHTTIHFPRGAIAAIVFDELPDVAAGELKWFVTAKVLGC